VLRAAPLAAGEDAGLDRPVKEWRMPAKTQRTTPAAETRANAVRDPEGTKAAILAAATSEFAEHGFGGARVDAIADRARINKRMLYHYWGDKEALYLAVLEKTYADIRSAEVALDLTHRAPEAALRELVLFTWHYFLEHPEFLSLLGTENLLKAKFLSTSRTIKAVNSPIIAALEDVIGRGQKAKLFRDRIDPLDTYLTIASLCFFYLSNRWTLTRVFGRDLMKPAEIERWGNHIVDVVLAHARSR
jgi:TetR/AcrR family transcriptional regulator